MGQRHGSAGVVPLVHAVRRRGFVFSADRFVGAAGHRVWQGGGGSQRVRQVVASRQLGARGLGDAAAAEGGDAAAVAAGEDGGIGDQAGRLALSRRRGKRWHCGLQRDNNRTLLELNMLFIVVVHCCDHLFVWWRLLTT